MNLEAAAREFVAMLSTWDLLLIFLVWLGLYTVEERFPEPFTKPRLGWRLMPFIPGFVCVPCMFVPGPWLPDTATWPMRVLFGLLLGVLAYNFGGIANRLGLGKIVNLVVTKSGKK